MDGGLIVYPGNNFPLFFQDPWVRNEVWRYDRRLPVNVAYGEKVKQMMGFRGLKYGIALAVVTAGQQTTFFTAKNRQAVIFHVESASTRKSISQIS